MKTIGNTLREARERQGLSIEDVAESTKIHPYKLTAIEEDDQNLLPARVFAVGLIKSYARELKVDMKLIDELCQKAYAEETPHIKIENTPPATSPATAEPPGETQPVGLFQIPKPFAIILSLGFILALTFSIYFVAQKMNSYSKEENQANSILDFDEEEVETATQDQPNIPNPEPATKSGAIEEESAQEALPEKEVPAVKSNTKTEPAEVEFEDNNNFEAENSTPTPSSNQDTENSPVVSFSDQKLTIKALDKVRIEIIWSDGYNQGLMLKRDESKTLIFSSPIRVRIDNGGAVEVSFNEKNQGVPGPLNKPIELKYP